MVMRGVGPLRVRIRVVESRSSYAAGNLSESGSTSTVAGSAAIVGAVFVLLAFQGGYWLVFGMFAILVWLGGVFGTLFLNGEKESLDAKAAAERRGKGVQ
jgi:membrane protein implicated in regulation of membrane protease activity